MGRNNKQFDAVRMMRSIRNRISKDISGMTFPQEQAYIHKRLGDDVIARFRVGGEGPHFRPDQTPEAGF